MTAPLDAERSRWPLAAAQAADDKLATDTLIIDVAAVLAITDFFIITTGNSPRQVKAIAQEIELQLKDAGGPQPHRIEGLDALEWVLLDFGDFVVHVMHSDTREYYELERLWADQPKIDFAPTDQARRNATS